jgi:hypothetical protein
MKVQRPRSPQQWAMLKTLPDAPSDGRRIKGTRLRTANSLVELGLARRIAGLREGEGGYYVRTTEGYALLKTEEARLDIAELDSRAVEVGARPALLLERMSEDPTT